MERGLVLEETIKGDLSPPLSLQIGGLGSFVNCYVWGEKSYLVQGGGGLLLGRYADRLLSWDRRQRQPD